jgi:hypothetical protein
VSQKIGECASADVREDPDDSFSRTLNLPPTRTMFMVGFKTDDEIHRQVKQ